MCRCCSGVNIGKICTHVRFRRNLNLPFCYGVNIATFKQSEDHIMYHSYNNHHHSYVPSRETSTEQNFKDLIYGEKNITFTHRLS